MIFYGGGGYPIPPRRTKNRQEKVYEKSKTEVITWVFDRGAMELYYEDEPPPASPLPEL